jgi:hypothetical protein
MPLQSRLAYVTIPVVAFATIATARPASPSWARVAPADAPFSAMMPTAVRDRSGQLETSVGPAAYRSITASVEGIDLTLTVLDLPDGVGAASSRAFVSSAAPDLLGEPLAKTTGYGACWVQLHHCHTLHFASDGEGVGHARLYVVGRQLALASAIHSDDPSHARVVDEFFTSIAWTQR